MTVSFVNYNAPHFVVNTSDIVESKVAGIGQRGVLVYDLDAKCWYVTKDDLTLASYAQGEINIGGALPEGEGHLGSVGGNSDIVEITLVLDTTQYGSGDVLAITAITPTMARINGGKVYPFAIQVTDEDDQGQGLDLLFFRSNVSIGTINQAYSIDDAGSRDLLGWVSVASTDYTDWGGFRSAVIKVGDTGWKMGILECGAEQKTLYLAAVSRGTGTYTASGIRLKISLSQD